MINDINWIDLHDSTLEKIEFNWETGLITITLRTSIQPFLYLFIICTGALQITCPRHCPWGMSVSVNKIQKSSSTINKSANRLEIEMQSGDIITIDALNFDITAKTSAGF